MCTCMNKRVSIEANVCLFSGTVHFLIDKLSFFFPVDTSSSSWQSCESPPIAFNLLDGWMTGLTTRSHAHTLTGDVTFENCPTSQSLVKGRSDGYIKCGVTADPPPIISWLKDDLPLHDDRYVIENNGIRVKGIVDEGDAGRFDVSARVEETGEVLYQLITVEVYGNHRFFHPYFPYFHCYSILLSFLCEMCESAFPSRFYSYLIFFLTLPSFLHFLFSPSLSISSFSLLACRSVLFF